MKIKVLVLLSVIVSLCFTSCISIPGIPFLSSPKEEPETDTLPKGLTLQFVDEKEGSADSSEESLSIDESEELEAMKSKEEIDASIEAAEQALELNHLSEAIKFYLSAMGKASKAKNEEVKTEISKKISQLCTRLTLAPHESWLNSDGTQKNGKTRDVANGIGIMPSVYLYQNYNYGKSAVADVNIRFEFISNQGVMTNYVTTDSNGLANTNITKIYSVNDNVIVRAYPVFTSTEGYSFVVKNIFRDFAYVAEQDYSSPTK